VFTWCNSFKPSTLKTDLVYRVGINRTADGATYFVLPNGLRVAALSSADLRQKNADVTTDTGAAKEGS
jgi:hypothetical protein